MTQSVKRLYQAFAPERYKLHLSIDSAKHDFSGTVVITGTKRKPSNRITLHGKDLKVTSASIARVDKKNPGLYTTERVNIQKSFDEIRIHTTEKMFPGAYEITLHFTGSITEPMNGIYPSTFTHDGVEKKLIATQFESHHAREAFPCVDEPEAKAIFELTLDTPAGEAVVSNTNPVSSATNGSVTTTIFQPTPKMSTYLLAFVVGELGYRESTTKSGTVVRTWATADNVAFTDFALNVATRCLDFYNEYFGIDYPLDKCDMIALPDFASGAMENWGCVTYREACMLVDPENTSLPAKQYVAMVVAHELAHQWFGNLVTMRWWTDLWLNEGFASWIEYLAVDTLFPEWNMWTQFHVDEISRALDLDSLQNTHPVEVAVPSPEEIRTIFDNISYAKGASIIHMLHEYLGAQDFKKGLGLYLRKHAYGNTDTQDLWESLQEASGKPVKDLMSAWTSQPGFPLLSITVDGDKLTAEQTRFVLNPRARQRDTFTETWPVPILPNFDVAGAGLLTKKSDTWKIPSSPPYVKLNSGQSGFYRCVYDPATTARLTLAASDGSLKPLDKIGFVSDTFVAALSGMGSTTATLGYLQTMSSETNAAVWEASASAIGAIRRVLGDDTMRPLLRPFVLDMVSVQQKRLGWDAIDDEPYFDSILRPLMLGLASFGDDSAVIEHATGLFEAAKSPEDIVPDIRGVVYGTVVRHGGADTFDKLLGFYRSTPSAEEKITLCSALTGFEQPELIERALGLIKTDDVRMQDVGYWLAYSFSNRYAKKLTWDWMVTNWQWLKNKHETDMSFSRIPLQAARSLYGEDELKMYQDYFATVYSPALARSINQGTEIIEWQTDWQKRDYEPVLDYLRKYQQKTR